MSLLILVPSGDKMAASLFAVFLSQQTGTPEWRDIGELKVVEVSNAVGENDQITIAELLEHDKLINSTPAVLIHPLIGGNKRASLSRIFDSRDIRVRSPGSITPFNTLVRDELKLRKLTWKARLENDLKHVNGIWVGNPSARLEQWLEQFEAHGYQGVGDWIGRCISIHPTGGIVDKFGLDAVTNNFDAVLLTKHKGGNLVLLNALQGRLGDYLQRLASKHVGAELSCAVQEIKGGKKCLLVTDWIHTGGEIMQALLPGNEGYFDNDLVDVIRQNVGSLTVRPALASRYGILRLMKWFESLHLPDILDLSQTDILENLRPGAEDASLVELEDGVWQRANIRTELECRMKALGAKKADIEVVINAVQILGSGLAPNDPLGSRSLGLTTNSVFSIPQGSLAVLRHSGFVQSHPQNPSVKKKWVPLYQHINLGSQ